MTRTDFNTLVLGYQDELTAFAMRLARNNADADDIVQGTYERALRSWRSLKDPARCRAWLFSIARNLSIDQRRTGAVQTELRLVGAPAHPTDAFVSASSIERATPHQLEGALAELPGAQREVVLLSDLWGFRYDEIAAIVRIPVGTVRSRLARARARLCERLADDQSVGSTRNQTKRDKR